MDAKVELKPAGQVVLGDYIAVVETYQTGERQVSPIVFRLVDDISEHKGNITLCVDTPDAHHTIDLHATDNIIVIK